MFDRRNAPLVPRNGHTLMVVIVARISGCAKQKELSLEDQEDHGKEVITDIYDGAVDYHVIATKGKGERLDRPELVEVEAALRTGEIDLLIVEDLGRLVRGAEAVTLLGICVDNGTRCISPQDFIDTNDANWEQRALEACAEHIGHNSRTSWRLKQKLMNRFEKFGGAPGRPIAGYTVRDDAQTYDDWVKDKEATPIIAEGLEILRRTLHAPTVAAYFNRMGFKTGPYCKSKEKWDGKLVAQFYRNPLLKGMPSRGTRHTKKFHQTGRRRSVKNTKGPTYYPCPHLAHVEPHEIDPVLKALDEKNARYKHATTASVGLRKKSNFPGGRHSRCWYCGRHHVWGGNGIATNLMCSGARSWLCWNSIGFEGAMGAAGGARAVLAAIRGLPGLQEQVATIIDESRRCLGDGDLQRRQLQERMNTLARERQNIVAAIRKFGAVPEFDEQMAAIVSETGKLEQERRRLAHPAGEQMPVPNLKQISEIFEEQFEKLAMESLEFGHELRRVIPDFYVYLVRLCDGGHLMPRAKIRISLDSIVPSVSILPAVAALLNHEVTFDLFVPPQREKIRCEAVRLAATGLECGEIAVRITEKPTATAVQNALALDRRMRAQGLVDPYVVVNAPPADYSKLRRHLNPQYKFSAAEGYVQPAI